MAVNTGIVVRLNSGGPPMTIVDANETLVTCNWFAGNDLRINIFPPAALTVEGE